MSSSVKFIRDPNPLGRLLLAPGGKSREEVLARAARGIEALRDWATDFMLLKIGEIEKVVATRSSDKTLSPDLLRTVLEQADSLLNLSETYGLGSLNSTCRSLCDLIVAMEQASVFDAEPVAIHVRALRLFAPGAAVLPPAEAAIILDDLSKLTRHIQRGWVVTNVD